MTGSFQRYLRAKRTVDDRALDRRLVDTLRELLSARMGNTDGPLRILEIGAGIGTMLTRFIEWDVLPAGETHYTAVDFQAENVSYLSAYLHRWAEEQAETVTDDPLEIAGPDRHIEVDPVRGDAVEYATATNREFDLLIGAALLDVMDRAELATLLGTLTAGGVYYFPITFDGATRFRPSHPADRTIERHYHDHMDAKQGGESRAGSDVLDRLQRLDGTTLSAVAGSDWIVRPVDDAYPADEAYFLSHILDTVEAAVSEIAGDESTDLDPWLATRRAQVAAAELVYHTHQLDFLGQIDS